MTARRRAGAALLGGLAVLAVAACASARPPTGEGTTGPPPIPTLGPVGHLETARVVRVVDGDTLVVRIEGREARVRYIGVDAPESVQPSAPVESYGPEAAAANRDLVDGRIVLLERDVSETDRFGRLLRYAWIHDGDRWVLVNLELVARGYAQALTIPPDVRLADLFIAAEQDARAAGRGLWGASGP